MPSQGLSGKESVNLMCSEFQGVFSFWDASYILGKKQWCVVMHMFLLHQKTKQRKKTNQINNSNKKAKTTKPKHLAS